jgi:hypothetical protein
MADGTLKVGTITTSSGSGTITLGQSGETITIPSGATVSGAMANTPAFAASVSSQSISNDVDTKLAFDTVVWDTDSAFASNKFTVPSGKGGKYYLQAHTQIPGIDDGELGQIMVYINGSHDQLASVRVYSSGTNQIFRMITAYTVELNAADYVEVYVYQNSGDAQTATNNYFTGHKLIGA